MAQAVCKRISYSGDQVRLSGALSEGSAGDRGVLLGSSRLCRVPPRQEMRQVWSGMVPFRRGLVALRRMVSVGSSWLRGSNHQDVPISSRRTLQTTVILDQVLNRLRQLPVKTDLLAATGRVLRAPAPDASRCIDVSP